MKYLIPPLPENPRYHDTAAGEIGDYRPVAKRMADKIAAECGQCDAEVRGMRFRGGAWEECACRKSGAGDDELTLVRM